ncbi:MAG: efflux RND transporter periplasmic adaptor subunit [Lachnospiraceae bacterium]|nr:efflux RND transporter periplasmic adaptor subunit [Lachnospiraceae bacterium]
MKKTKIISVIIFSILAMTLSACSEKAVASEESIADKPIMVKQQLPDVKSLATMSNYVGTVEADSTVNILPKVSAEVLSANYVVGDHVNAGDLLFTMDDSTAQIALDQANAGLKSAKAGLDAAEANYEAGKASLVAQEASKTATQVSAYETLGKLDTTGQQMQLAADSAYVQARQAGLNSDSAHETYEFYNSQIEDAERKKNELLGTEDMVKTALAGSQAALSQASKTLGYLTSIKTQYENFNTPGMTPEEFLQSAGFSSVEALNQAIKEAQTKVAAAQTGAATASEAYSTTQTALESVDSALDQLYLQRDTAGNTAESASLSYGLAVESSELADRQEQDFDNYTRYTITSGALAQAIGAEQQLKASGAQVKAGGAQVAVGSAGVDQANAAVANARTALSYYSVSAPVSGTITAINVSEHNICSPSQVAYTIKSDAAVKIVFYVAEKSAQEMFPDDPVSLEKDGNIYEGRIILVSNELDAQKGLYRVEAQLLDPSVSLPYDSTISLRAASRQVKDALTVPVNSVYYDNDQAYLFVNDNGIAKRKDVSVGLSEGDSIEIKEGLGANDSVITSWTAGLKEGTKVMTDNSISKEDIIVVVE